MADVLRGTVGDYVVWGCLHRHQAALRVWVFLCFGGGYGIQTCVLCPSLPVACVLFCRMRLAVQLS